MSVTFKFESNKVAALSDMERKKNRALDRCAIAWHNAARQATPVDTGRLRASLSWATPTNKDQVGRTYNGGVIQYTPPDPAKDSAEVGSNVEYALAVHEGINTTVAIKAHDRKITKVWGRTIKPKVIKVKAHTRKVNRRPIKFIEGPGRLLVWYFKEVFTQEMSSS